MKHALEDHKAALLRFKHCNVTVKGVYPRALKIVCIEVDPKYRGTGEGRNAMSEICDFLDQEHASGRLEVQPLDDDIEIERLIGFYKSFGFEIASQKPKLLMQRKPML